MQQLLIDARNGLILNVEDLARLDAQTITDIIDTTQQVIDSINFYSSNLSSLDQLSRDVDSFVTDASSSLYSAALSSATSLIKNTMDTIINAGSYSANSSSTIGILSNTDAAA